MHVRVALYVALALCLCGCSDDKRRGLTFELAPLSSTGCGSQREPLPSTISCIRLQVCRRTETGSCEPVPVVVSKGDHKSDATELFVPLGSDRRVIFDAKLESNAEYLTTATVYETKTDGTLAMYAKGSGAFRSSGKGAIRVRMFRPGMSACAGSRPRPRALHQAAVLPNGDVLIFGGVAGPDITFPESLLSFPPTGTLEPTIEMYRPGDQRFYDVRFVGEGDGVRRVFLTSIGLPGVLEGGRYRIRVVGGFTGTTGVLRIDTQQVRSYYTAPILPGPDMQAAEDIDLVYDPATLTVSTQPVQGQLFPPSGMSATTDFDNLGHAAVLLGLASSGANGIKDAVRPMLHGKMGWLNEDGRLLGGTTTLAAERMGATITRPRGVDGVALIWGGNVNKTSLAEVQATAGELMFASGALSSIASGATGLTDPTAFHSADVIAGGILIAGGLKVGWKSATPDSTIPIQTAFNDARMFVLRVTGTSVTEGSVDSSEYQPSIFHSSLTILDPSTQSLAVLVSGGITTLLTFTPSAQLALVARNGSTYRAVPLTSTLPVNNGMAVARWGHVLAPLPDQRILVTGGFGAPVDRTANVLDVAEVIDYNTPEPPPSSCGAMEMLDGGNDASQMNVDAGEDSSTSLDAGNGE